MPWLPQERLRPVMISYNFFPVAASETVQKASPKCVLNSSVLPVVAVVSQSNNPVVPWCVQLPCRTHDPGERLGPAVCVYGVRRAALQLRHLRGPVPQRLPVPLPRRLRRAPL